MTAAANLFDAANLTAANLYPLWVNDTLQAAVVAYAATPALATAFEEAATNNHPIGNWLAVIAAQATAILPYVQGEFSSAPYGIGTITAMNKAVDYIYRLCKLGFALNEQDLITDAQAAALLAAYNDNFA
jgi:hypothetical protein